MMSLPISSITRGPRQSNFELLRLFAMFLVLIVHSDFWTLGRPTIANLEDMPIQSLTKVFFESISVVCVNCFILISGWFGIRPTLRGLSNFIFQCLYFIIGCYTVRLIIFGGGVTINGIMQCLLLTPNSWFIHSYIGLYILSPVLNEFLNKASQKTIRIFLIIFFLYQSTYGWFNGAQYFMLGYSAISFAGLYLLAGYVKRYPNRLIYQKTGGYLYAISIICNTALYYAVTFIGFPLDVYAYCSPFIVMGAVGLLLIFKDIKIKTSKIINRLALSAFAVYLFHTETSIGVMLFKACIVDIYNNYSGVTSLLLIGLVLITFYVFAILLDQPRYFIWKYLSHRFFNK